jgi:hypothetical protein
MFSSSIIYLQILWESDDLPKSQHTAINKNEEGYFKGKFSGVVKIHLPVAYLTGEPAGLGPNLVKGRLLSSGSAEDKRPVGRGSGQSSSDVCHAELFG